MNEHLKNSHRVPEWVEYYPSLSNATNKQKNFYKYWLNEFERGCFIDIEGNLSYIYVYIYTIIDKFLSDKNVDSLIESFEKINQGYGDYENINTHLTYWMSDAYLYLGDYDNAWKIRKGRSFFLTDILSIKAKCTDKSIDADDLISVFQKTYLGLTKFGVEHISQVKVLAKNYLEEFHKEHGENLIEYFIRKFNTQDLTEDDFLLLKDYFQYEKDFSHCKDQYFLNQDRYNKRVQEALDGYLKVKKIYDEESDVVKSWKEDYDRILKEKNTCAKSFFAGVPWNMPMIRGEAVPGIVQTALENEIKRIFREFENTIREEMNLPKIGEGWLQETELFCKLIETFPKEKIIHHGRPAWLSSQHLDIYFPMRNIGIEYQGYQHNNPIEYFGGEKAFKLQQKRDKRKNQLCKENGCVLIYVYNGYSFKDIQQVINNIIINDALVKSQDPPFFGL